jgi:conserved domain protein
MAETNNTLTIKFDKETTLPLLEGLGKSAYAIAVAHGFKGDEQAWLDSLRGPKGDKGSAEETAQILKKDGEFLKSVKGPKGDAGSSEKAAELLKNKNVYLPDASVETVLAKLVELVGDSINVTYKPIEYIQPLVGQQYLDLKGEPHFKVSVNGGEKHVFESDNMRVNIPAFGEDDIIIKYYDLTDREAGQLVIKGIPSSIEPDQEYTENGIQYKLYDDTLKINVTNNTVNGNFNDNPKGWNVTSKRIYANNPTVINLGDNWNTYGPYYIETPEKVTFKGQNKNMHLTIATSKQGAKTLAFNNNTIKWDAPNNSYINTGGENDGL